jgi:hypothetical protein
MAESAEHQFLKSEATRVLAEFSKLRLYGYTETDRKKFDFSCLLERDWTRPLVGQVLWKHAAGIDKDLRTLLFDSESEIRLYIARDEVEHHQLFEEAIGDFRRSAHGKDLFRLKTIWVPPDFDADREAHQAVIRAMVRERIVEDILINVVFGNLSEEHLRLFLSASGVPGLNLAILSVIAREGFLNIAALSKRLAISAGPIREKLPLLNGAGFIEAPIGELRFKVTSRGKVFLELLRRFAIEAQNGVFSNELSFILSRIGCQPVTMQEVDANREIFSSNLSVLLLKTAISAKNRWGVEDWRDDA